MPKRREDMADKLLIKLVRKNPFQAKQRQAKRLTSTSRFCQRIAQQAQMAARLLLPSVFLGSFESNPPVQIQRCAISLCWTAEVRTVALAKLRIRRTIDCFIAPTHMQLEGGRQGMDLSFWVPASKIFKVFVNNHRVHDCSCVRFPWAVSLNLDEVIQSDALPLKVGLGSWFSGTSGLATWQRTASSLNPQIVLGAMAARSAVKS